MAGARRADGGARVVALSSTGHKLSGIRFDDLQFEHGYDKWQAYGQAKTANSLFAVQLDALGQDAGVRAFAVHPGGIMTPLQRHLTREEMRRRGWIDADGNARASASRRPSRARRPRPGRRPSPQLDGMGGVYCEDCDIAEPTEAGRRRRAIARRRRARDRPRRRRRACGRVGRAHRRRRVRRRLGPRGPNQVVSASASPCSVRSPTQATYPSGRINTAVGAVTAPSAGSSHAPAYLASIS